MAGPFVIVFPGRTGSTYLVESLDLHPDIVATGEWLKGVGRREGAQAQLLTARSYLSEKPVGDPTAWGFKLKLRDVLDRVGYAEVLAAVRARIIRLDRQNKVKWAVSHLNAVRIHEQSGDWNVYSNSSRPGPLTVPPAQLLEEIAKAEKQTSEIATFVEQLGLPTLSVDYQELTHSEDATMRRIFAFLGVDWAVTRAATVKATEDDLRDALANFDEMRTALAGTPYEGMLTERRDVDPDKSITVESAAEVERG